MIEERRIMAADKKISCACGKMLARMENGTIFLWCKECRKEIPFVLVQTGPDTFTLKRK